MLIQSSNIFNYIKDNLKGCLFLYTVPMKYSLFISCLFFLQFALAQNEETSDRTDVNNYLVNSAGGQMPTLEPFNKDIEGDYYLYDKWDNYAKIYTNGKSLKLNSFNYNLYRDMVETKIASDSVFSFNSSAIDSIVVNNRTLKTVRASGEAGASFAVVLYENKGYTFFKKFSTKIRKAEVNPISGGFDFADRIEKIPAYYLSKPEGQIREIDLKKRDILRALDLDKSELKKFTKKNNLSVKQEEDVIKIVEHFVNN